VYSETVNLNVYAWPDTPTVVCSNSSTDNMVSALASFDEGMFSVSDPRTVCVEKPVGASWASNHYYNSINDYTLAVYGQWSGVVEEFSMSSCCDRLAHRWGQSTCALDHTLEYAAHCNGESGFVYSETVNLNVYTWPDTPTVVCSNSSTDNMVSALASLVTDNPGMSARMVCVEKPVGASWASNHYHNSINDFTLAVYGQWSGVVEEFSMSSRCDRLGHADCSPDYILDYAAKCDEGQNGYVYSETVYLSVYAWPH